MVNKCKDDNSEGFLEIPNRPNVYYHSNKKLLLVVYVDDFKMSGPPDAVAWGWKELARHIEMDPPTPEFPCTVHDAGHGKIRDEKGSALKPDFLKRSARYLGCEHITQTVPVDSELAQKLLTETAPVRVQPPEKPMEANESNPTYANASKKHINTVKYDMSGALAGAVDKYIAVAPNSTKLRQVKTPFIDEALLPDGQDPGEIPAGTLGPHASSVLMSLLYTARMARYDLLRPVCALASMVSRWNVHCDRMLYKLVGYVDTSKDDVFMHGFIGDDWKDLTLRLYTDADLASCKLIKKSTSGVFLVLAGPNSWFPLVGVSTKQTATSHSSTESELVGEDLGLRKEAMPMLDILKVLNGGKDITFDFLGDN